MAEPDEHEGESYDEEPPRSIFSALWFRALIVVLVLGVVAAIAVPYVLDVLSPPVRQPVVVTSPPKPAPAPAPVPPPVASAPPEAAAPPLAPAAGNKPAAAHKPAAPDKPATAGKPVAADRSTQAAKVEETPPVPAAKAPESAAATPEVARAVGAAAPKAATKSAAPSKPAAARSTAAAKTEASSAPEAGRHATAAGEYFVQVGAFRDQAAARRVAARLREQHYNVVESVKPAPAAGRTSPAGAEIGPAPAAGDRYDVFVSGASPAEIDSRLTARGLAVESVAGGVVVKPSLPLREAVSLSKDLAADGLKVQVRRAGGQGAARETSAATALAAAGETLYRVRVGGYPDRGAAQAAARELEAKGYRPFIARGGQ